MEQHDTQGLLPGASSSSKSPRAPDSVPGTARRTHPHLPRQAGKSLANSVRTSFREGSFLLHRVRAGPQDCPPTLGGCPSRNL